MSRKSLLSASRSIALETRFSPPLFLAPALQPICPRARIPQSESLITTTTSPFSTNTTLASRTRARTQRPRDKNKNRGVSAIRRTGPRFPLTISQHPLPQPSPNAEALRREFPTRPDHGLWDFFNKDRTPITKPEELNAHGRAWTEAELMLKSWQDLHVIWWGCMKERNWLSTDALERQRAEAGYGDYEMEERVETILETMTKIKTVLLNRVYAWEQASKMVETAEYWKGELAVPPEQKDDGTDAVNDRFTESESEPDPVEPEATSEAPKTEEPMPTNPPVRDRDAHT